MATNPEDTASRVGQGANAYTADDRQLRDTKSNPEQDRDALVGAREQARADWRVELMAAFYRAWPDAEDMPDDDLGIIGNVERLVAERDDLRGALDLTKADRDKWFQTAQERRSLTPPTLEARSQAETDLLPEAERIVFKLLHPWANWDDFDARREVRGGPHPQQAQATEIARAVLTLQSHQGQKGGASS